MFFYSNYCFCNIKLLSYVLALHCSCLRETVIYRVSAMSGNCMESSNPSPSPCPCCGRYRTPSPTVDVVIYDVARGIVLVKRKNEPFGWALPGGFVDYGESVERAAIREAKEETGLVVTLTGLVGVYSDPARDPRRHTISTVFSAEPANPEDIAGGDDAEDARFFPLDALPQNIVFDHNKIIVFWGRRATSAVSGYPRKAQL